MRYSTISFLSDFGHQDEFVGVVHSVIQSIAPEVRVVDLTHGIRSHDVRAGALALARSANYLCPGVVLAVVDPGVGTDRRAIAVEVGEGASVLVGPDNGVLASAVAMVGGADRAVELTNTEYQLARMGSTFDGRDIFAPAAAHLAMGVDLAELGEQVEVTSLTPGLLPVIAEENGQLVVEALWIDRYGNVQLNVGPDDLAPWGDPFTLIVGDQRHTIARSQAYRHLSTGEIGAIVDSSGLISLALNGSSAAEALGVSTSDEIRIAALDDANSASPTPGMSTSVTLGKKS